VTLTTKNTFIHAFRLVPGCQLVCVNAV